MNLRRKMSLVAFLPLSAGLALLGYVASERIGKAAEVERLSAAAPFAAEINAVIHALQAERGRSVAYASTGGDAAARDALEAQRARTDGVISNFGAFLSDGDFEGKLPEIWPEAAAIAALSGRLAATRDGVDAASMKPAEFVSFYSHEVAAGIEAVYEAIKVIPDHEAAMSMSSFALLLQAMESGGLERA